MPSTCKQEERTLKPKNRRSEPKFAEIVGRKSDAVALAHYILDSKRFAQDTQKLSEKQVVEARDRGKKSTENPPRSGRK